MTLDTSSQTCPAEDYRDRARRCREHAATVKSHGVYRLLSEMAQQYESRAQAAAADRGEAGPGRSRRR
jgi:hypothetical protein